MTSKSNKGAGFWHFVDNLQGDKVVWMIVLILICFSIVAVFSSTPLLALQQHTSRMAIVREQLVLAAIGLALVLASYLDMAERSGHLLVFTSVPLFLLSGVAWPLQAMPAWLAGFSSSLPSTVGINTFVRINQMGV